MAKRYDFEYIIVGSGPAGAAVALGLGKAKKRVAVIEAEGMGGSNINTSDIPYRVALDFTHDYAKMLLRPEFKNQDIHFNLPTVLNEEKRATLEARKAKEEAFRKAGVAYIGGYANFLDEHTIAIGSNKLTSENFVLATGSHLKTSGIAGIETVDYLTPANAIRLRRLPKVILIVGGGATGCEIASFYAELGVKVVIMEAEKRLLPKEDKEVSAEITDYLVKEHEALIVPNSKVIAVERDNNGTRVIFKNGRGEKNIKINYMVLATGYEPNLGYGLENAKVKYKETGILVDKYFGTSTKNIYALGDAIHNGMNSDSSTTQADYEGNFLVTNLLGKSKNLISYKGFSRVIKCFPEVVTIGLNEEELIKRKRKYRKAIVKLKQIPASRIYNFQYGFVKLLVDSNNRLIGASVVSPYAEPISAELSLAVRHHLSALELASTPHAVNDWSYAIKLAAKKLVPKKK